MEDIDPFRVNLDEDDQPKTSSSYTNGTKDSDLPPPPSEETQPEPSTSTSPPKANNASPGQGQVKRIETRLRDDPNAQPIYIVDAVKTSEGGTSSYIAYVVRSELGEARRRYSEFEALRNVLSRLYPVLIIPPIPPHHTLTDYAAKQTKAKEDANVIARRRRMLAVFLNRLNRHPIISKEKVFRRFLEPTATWAEIIHSPPVTLLPKNILKASAQNPTDATLANLYATLPLPSASQQLQDPDQRFQDSEAFTSKFSAHLSGSTEKVNRRLMKRWIELGGDHADFGGLLNGFSLTELNPQLSHVIERTGQAVDGTYVHTTQMMQEWEKRFTEPMAEYGQFSAIIKQLLKYRHQKHLQYEMTRDVLENKKAQLEEFERSELEARRLDQALDQAAHRVQALDPEGEPENDGSAPTNDHTTSSAASFPEPAGLGSVNSTPPPSARRSGGSSMGFIGALTHSFQNVMDVDPESSRRNSIGKTRESIGQLDEGLRLTLQDLRFASTTIQADLDRFQRQKVTDLREMCLAFCAFHKEWCRKNLEQWEEVKRELAKLSDEKPQVET